MIITVDIGNSNTVIVTYDGDARGEEIRFETSKEEPTEYYMDKFSNLSLRNPEAILVSCVVPRIQETVTKVITEIFGMKPIFIDANSIRNFNIKLSNPKEIGADFIATSFGAIGKYKLPAIVADIGSATKLTVVELDGTFGGGVIVPGLGTSVEAMYQYIPHLPQVALEVPTKIIGNDTIDAIQSGILYGLIAQIEGLADKMEQEVGQPCSKILTGGYANIIADKIKGFTTDPQLLNDGLYEIYKRGAYYE